ncbi:MAG: TIGR04053 family radical SAM/SPASM domain-containing protein [Chloroflexi bacterium]|nr:MAG: TIGR04053 family radical SAM/SPASM domain-containing protein [Chloroflexota bacterium]MCE7858367.1 TIGR04053 family radical SAM/SPASM domain-containing protein [Chloroflexi bacterium CFX2]
MTHVDFDQAPFTIAWEVTRACAYACVHCRADAQHHRDPRELSTDEAKALIERLAAFGNNPILIFTGGDPLMRPDVFELIAYANERGLRCSLTPTATALPTKERLEKARDAGIKRVALSLDAPHPEIHDEFRQVQGSWQRTMDTLHRAHDVGLSVQVNTTVAKHNIDILHEMVPFIQEVGAVQWSVFFLVPTGRAMREQMVSAEQHERVFNWLYNLSQNAPFDIKSTAAPMYRRVAIERKRAENTGKPVTFQSAGFQYADGLHRPTKGVNDGNGFLFISHIGEIQPSGFLPVTAGMVRENDVVDVYRNSQIFKDLRNPSKYKGVCGTCTYNDVCGGQRGRAYGVTGDYLESDPACVLVAGKSAN